MSADPTRAVIVPAWRWNVDQSQLRLADGLANRLDNGELIACVGRSSTPSGDRANAYAVRDLENTVEHLALDTGIDLSPHLPSEGELKRLLREAPSSKSVESNGNVFRNRFVVVDRARSAGVLFLLSTGSASKLTRDGTQPFVVFAVDLVRSRGVALFYCFEFDRGGRETFGLGPLAIALRERYFGDRDSIMEVTDESEFVLFVKGSSGRKQAKSIRRRTRKGQLNMTGREMIGGQVPFHAGGSVPPGFATTWLKGVSSVPTERLLHLDSGPCRPADHLVAFGMSEVRDEDGDRVDQVENVRFFLTRLGKPGWTLRRMTHELAARRLSAEHFRDLHGVEEFVDAQSARSVMRGILDNLDVYETGRLTRGLGAGVDPVTIEGCVPPDGPWASREDFRRIRAYLEEHRIRQERATTLTFAGLSATYDGSAVSLRSARRIGGEERPGYRFARAENRDRVVQDNLMLPADAFAASIRDGILRAGEEGMRLADLLNASQAADDGGSRLRAERSQLRAEVAARKKENEGLFSRLTETSPDGTPTIKGALLGETQRRYNELAEETIPALSDRLREVNGQLEDLAARQPRGVGAEALLHLVASLRNVSNPSFRETWLSTIRDLHFSHERFRMSDRMRTKGRRLHWQGVIEVNHDDHTYAIPFSGEYEQGAAVRAKAQLPTAAKRVVSEMREGTPLASRRLPLRRSLVGEICKELRADFDTFLLAECDDSRITRTAIAVLERRDEPLEVVARDLGEPVEFITRIRNVHLNGSTGRRSWRRTPAAAIAALYIVASYNGGTVDVQTVVDMTGCSRGSVYNYMSGMRAEGLPWVTHRKRGYELLPCGCGSRRRMATVIPEPVGPICLECRQDMAGVVWPVEPYDRYLVDRCT